MANPFDFFRVCTEFANIDKYILASTAAVAIKGGVCTSDETGLLVVFFVSVSFCFGSRDTQKTDALSFKIQKHKVGGGVYTTRVPLPLSFHG